MIDIAVAQNGKTDCKCELSHVMLPLGGQPDHLGNHQVSRDVVPHTSKASCSNYLRLYRIFWIFAWFRCQGNFCSIIPLA
jgi:hypothetical protein